MNTETVIKMGLIPAHAGKTGVIPANTVPDWAHPRSRGENPHAREGDHQEAGSSPLTRGKRGEDRFTLAGLGLIPAHAGKTPGDVGGTQSMWAHPRSRGENTS